MAQKNIAVPRKSGHAGSHDGAGVPISDAFAPAPSGHPRSLLRKKFEQKQIQTLSKIEGEDLSKVFEALGKEGGTVDQAKFKAAMLNSGNQIYQDDAVVDALWNALDVNKDMSIDSKELLLGLAALNSGDLDQKLRFGFKLFDLNNDGGISREELSTMISHIAKVKYSKNDELEIFVKEFVESTFAKFDANKDNVLSFDEFTTASKDSDGIRAFFTLSVSKLS